MNCLISFLARRSTLHGDRRHLSGLSRATGKFRSSPSNSEFQDSFPKYSSPLFLSLSSLTLTLTLSIMFSHFLPSLFDLFFHWIPFSGSFSPVNPLVLNSQNVDAFSKRKSKSIYTLDSWRTTFHFEIPSLIPFPISFLSSFHSLSLPPSLLLLYAHHSTYRYAMGQWISLISDPFRSFLLELSTQPEKVLKHQGIHLNLNQAT